MHSATSVSGCAAINSLIELVLWAFLAVPLRQAGAVSLSWCKRLEVNFGPSTDLAAAWEYDQSDGA